MSMFLPADVPGEIADRYQMEIMLNQTTKPILFVSYDFPGCVDPVEMAETVAGGSRRSPTNLSWLATYNITTGLRQNEDSLQKLLYLARKNLPFIYVPGASGGLAGPITPAGNMAVRYAGALAGLVISQLMREGAPIIMPGYADTSLDMRTMIMPYCEPDHRGGLAAVCHHYGLAYVYDRRVHGCQTRRPAGMRRGGSDPDDGCPHRRAPGPRHGLHGDRAVKQLQMLTICDEIVAWIKNFGLSWRSTMRRWH